MNGIFHYYVRKIPPFHTVTNAHLFFLMFIFNVAPSYKGMMIMMMMMIIIIIINNY